ncbi:MAG TPA: carboxypeptidase regulatory-like domain-containing protein, partial [Terriglobales bacterium]|nr:carboxypeptidase regulatory-like domain-containing protein [Terriglobales bacterium]
ETLSSSNGSYSFTDVPAGTYTLTVTAANFGPKMLSDLNVTPGVELPLEVALEVGAAIEQVNVQSSNAGKVETENATVSGTIAQKEVQTLQLNGRNFSQLIALAPGVSNQTGQDEGKVGVVGSVKYSVNGGRVEYNSFEVDGSDVLNTGLNRSASTLVVYPSIDSIQEVKVLTSNYGAQYGRTASGTVQVTTRSGTNQFHGGVYDFVRNEWFNARNYFDLTTKAPLYRRQDFGGTIGGPLTIPGVYNKKRDRTFFFFSEEVRLEKTPIDYNQAVPGLKERGLIITPQGIRQNLGVNPNALGQVAQIFDFTDVCPPSSALSNNTFDRQQYPDCPAFPYSGATTHTEEPVYFLEGAQSVSQPVLFGVDKNSRVILNSNLIPLPNSPVGCNYTLPATTILGPDDPNRCYVASVSPSTYWREELFKIDHNLTQKLKVSFRYIHDEWKTTVLTPQWSYLSVTNPAAETFPTIQNSFYGPGISLVANLTHTITPTLINSLVLSYANSTITLADKNGPGGAQFQRNPALDRPLVASSTGECDPIVSRDPATLLPECAMGYLFNNRFGGKMPGVAILGSNAAYGGRGFVEDPSYMPWEHSDPTYSARDDVGKSVGKHTLQFGAQYVYYQRNQLNNVIGAASGDVEGLVTYSNLANSTGNAFADFLAQYQPSSAAPNNVQGFIQGFTQDTAQHRYYQRYQLAEPYIQDDWKVTPRLTLNLGLRLSLFGTYSEKNHAAWNWEASRFDRRRFSVDPNSGILLDGGNPVTFNAGSFALDPSVVSGLGLVQCGISGTPASCMQGHLFNWAPRIGFAWDPKGDGKTSIRGGYGIFYEHGTGNEANTGSLEASAPVVLSATQPIPFSIMCIGGVGFGPTVNQQLGPGNYCGSTNVAPNSLFPIDVTSIPTKAVWPYVQQWSFGIQRELARDFVINLGYAGSKGTHLTVERQLNQLPPLPASENPFGPNEPLTINDCTVGPGGVIPGSGTNPFQLESGTIVSATSPAYTYLQAACTNPNIPNVNSLPLRPYHGLGRVLSLQNVADSSYHAFQFTARRTRGALTTGLSYSYSHSIDDSSDRSDPVLVNSYDLRENRASSNFDERHLLTVSYIYQFSLRMFRNIFDWANERKSTNGQDPTSSAPKGFKGGILDGWELSGITLLHSGTPFSVINTVGNTGISVTDNAGVSSNLGVAASYPDVMKDMAKPENNSQSFGPLQENPSQFVAPRGLTFGNAGRNFLNNPRQVNFDMALAKHFKVTESSELVFRAEAFNIFNHTEFRTYDPDNPGSTGNNTVSCYAGPAFSAGYKGKGTDCVTGASFLHPVDAHRPRTLQLALKLSF